MRTHNSFRTSRFYLSIFCAGAVAAGLSFNAAGLSLSTSAQITVDGTLDPAYGSALAVQTINTGFGDSTVGDGTSAGGSELDAAYGTMQGGYLDIFLAGNFEDNGNHVNVFVSDGAGGQNTLNVAPTATLQTMNGSVFSPGFNANLAIDLNDYQGTAYIEEYVGAALNGGYVGAIGLSGGIGTGSPGPNGILYGFNDTHVSTMGATGTAANPAAMLSTTTGLEIGIPLSSLAGYTSGSINVLADINGGGDDWLSDQFLPGLGVGTGNLGSPGTFNFGSTPGEYFTVVPEPGTITLLGLSLAGWLSSRRRK
jgi:hypothetical protein